jgi:hypothetical protein
MKKEEKDPLVVMVRKFRKSVFPNVFLAKAKQAFKLGQRKMALLALGAVLEIDPENSEAKRLLKN